MASISKSCNDWTSTNGQGLDEGVDNFRYGSSCVRTLNSVIHIEKEHETNDAKKAFATDRWVSIYIYSAW
jgi:hypothetical protein